jgi:hypothetical protein
MRFYGSEQQTAVVSLNNIKRQIFAAVANCVFCEV